MASFTGYLISQYNGTCNLCYRNYKVGDSIHVKENVKGATHTNCVPRVITKIVTRDITQAIDSFKDSEIAKLKRRVKELENEVLSAKDEVLIYKKMVQ